MCHSLGPVVRVGPNEVHLTDPSNYDKLYSMTTKFTKDPAFYSVFGNPESHFSMISNEMHRKQRAALNPFFSKKSVLLQEDIVQEKAQQLCDRVEQDTFSDNKCYLSQIFRALSMDVISEYSFGEQSRFEFLSAPDLGMWWNDMLRGLNEMLPLAKLAPGLLMAMQSLPDWVSVKINPVVRGMVSCQMVSYVDPANSLVLFMQFHGCVGTN